MSDGEKDAQELSIGNAGGIEDDFDGLCVAGGFGDDLPVGGRFRGAARIAGGGLNHAFDTLKDRLSSPKTSTGEDCRFPARSGRDGRIHFRRRNRRTRRCIRGKGKQKYGESNEEKRFERTDKHSVTSCNPNYTSRARTFGTNIV